jgi:hypothetical protein
VLVAGSRLAVLILAPEGRSQRPDDGIRQAGMRAASEISALG